MNWKEVEFTHDLPAVIRLMGSPGLLLTSVDAGGVPNTMAIGWGTPGIIWGRPIFTVLVRPSRYTFGHIEATGEFVVSVPAEGMEDDVLHCGTASGRDEDKFAACDFTTTPGETVRVPLIDQCVQHYECRVLHRNDIVDGALDAEVREGCYPSGDLHRLYYGEILRTVVRA